MWCTSRLVVYTLRISTLFSKEYSHFKCSSRKSYINHSEIIVTGYLRSLFTTTVVLHEPLSSLQIKKRPTRKKPVLESNEQQGFYNVLAFSTAEEYNLEALEKGLLTQKLYEPKHIDNLPDVLYAVANYHVTKEPRELFFFREGTIVLWNITDLECENLIDFLKPYEKDSYASKLVQSESEIMKYHRRINSKSTIDQSTGKVCIATDDNILEKYTFSNTIASSVKLGIWEANLNKFIDSIEYVTEDLKRGAKIKMSIEDVVSKQGELYSLRHLINLSSDLLDTPDFYWEHEDLERLYMQGYTYFNIARRTKVINEKISHCIELIDLLSRQLSDSHHVRLEWMIIILIMMAVGFETLHYIDKYS